MTRLSRRIAVVFVLSSAVALSACGKRGDLELPGPTPSPIGGPTPPTPPAQVDTASDPANPPRRQVVQEPPSSSTNVSRRSYDPYRPVGRGQMMPSGTFVLDPLL